MSGLGLLRVPHPAPSAQHMAVVQTMAFQSALAQSRRWPPLEILSSPTLPRWGSSNLSRTAAICTGSDSGSRCLPGEHTQADARLW